jgi:transitional endoplasmic reticulum ATPase
MEAEKQADGIQFKVAEAFLEDVGKGFARLDADDLKRLHAAPGDVLVITGRRSTVARAAQAPPSHCGQFLILMDGTTRDNAQAGVDEYVTVRKVPFKTAESLLLASVQADRKSVV